MLREKCLSSISSYGNVTNSSSIIDCEDIHFFDSVGISVFTLSIKCLCRKYFGNSLQWHQMRLVFSRILR